jgi:cell division inhibitor SepF
MMPLLNRGAIANFFGLADEEEYEEYPEASKPAVSQPTKPRVTQTQQPRTVSKQSEQQTKSIHPAKPEYVQANDTKKVIELHQSSNKKIRREEAIKSSVTSKKNLPGKITVMEPRAYSEAMAIAKRIIAGEATLVNFHLVEEKQARRIVDFLTGTVYALDGDIKRVGDEIFLCTPKGMEIDSSTAQSFADVNMFDL